MRLIQIAKAVVPLAVVAVGALGAQGLIATRPKPPKKPRAERAVLVEVESVEKTSQPVRVSASGVVIPAYQVELAAEVGGRVVWKNSQLTAGGLVKQGETLLRIDPRDYKLAIEQQAAALERAKTEVDLESGRKRVAEAEWQRFGDEDGDASEALALREPQHKVAQLGMRTAEAALEQAKLQYGRTVIKAPFDAVVRSNSTEEGRLVTPGQSLANLIDTRLFLVSVSVPLADLRWLKIPGTNAPVLTQEIADEARAAEDPAAAFAELSSLVRITQRVGGDEIERGGVIVRMLGDLDPAGRMARLLVSVQDPLGRDSEQKQQEGVASLPILIGAYVNVEIAGRHVHDVIEVPRVALREGGKVYLMSQDDTLQEREVEILHRTEDSVLVSSGLSEGDRVITSALAAPVLGMELRVADSEQQADDGGPPRAQAAQPPKQAQPVDERVQ